MASISELGDLLLINVSDLWVLNNSTSIEY